MAGVMTIDATGIIQIITAATTFVATIGTAVVIVIKELRSVAAKVEAVAVKADVVAVDQNKQLDTIHKNGNDHLGLITGKLAESEKRNEDLVRAMRESVEKSDRESTARIERLELLLTMSKQLAPAPAPAPAAAAQSEGAEQRTIRIEDAAGRIVQAANEMPRLVGIQGDVSDTKVIVEDTQEILKAAKAPAAKEKG